MSPRTDCGCARGFRLEQGRAADARRAKRALDVGKHPAYLSVARLESASRKGGVFYAVFDGMDLGVAVIRPAVSSLTALNIHPEHRSHGLGGALLRWVAPNWARVIESAVPWFEQHGFEAIGPPRQGRRHKTFVMVRSDLIRLAGRLDRLDAGEPDGEEILDAGVEAR